MHTITPFLWFDNQAEEAVNFYTSNFKNSRIIEVARYGEGAPVPSGTVMVVTFELEGQKLMALNGGPDHKFTDAISLYVSCETQQEVDDLWEKLTRGGEEGPCGWLKDRYGLTWQIVPAALGEMLGDPDPVKAKRVMEAMLKMKKLDIETLRRARER